MPLQQTKLPNKIKKTTNKTSKKNKDLSATVSNNALSKKSKIKKNALGSSTYSSKDLIKNNALGSSTYSSNDLTANNSLASIIYGKESFLSELRHICQQALSEGNLKCALEAEKMIGQAHGFFHNKNKALKNDSTNNGSQLCLAEMTDNDIDHLIKQLKNKHQK